MGQYIKKHRRQFAGIAVPLLLLFVLGALGLSIFPGWLKPSFGLPGTVCDSANGGLFNDSCDPCNGEICSFNSPSTEFQCGVPVIVNGTISTFDFSASATFPQCPIVFTSIISQTLLSTQFPGCWDVCNSTVDTAGLIPVCSPNLTFCDGLSGGTQQNDCRTGTCTANSAFTTGNPTGCDYDYDTANTDCINCAPPTPQTVNCGNGVCEPASGEDFFSCSVDCRAPDFDSPAPIPEDPDPSNPTASLPLNAACRTPTASISFSGNLPSGGTCEDGDVCTTNTCTFVNQIPFCDIEPAQCNNTVIDFCCPDGCTSSDDLDCLPPEVCEPSPTPIPTPPVTGLVLHGDGCSSLHAGAIYPSGGAWLLFAGAALVGWFRFRQKAS